MKKIAVISVFLGILTFAQFAFAAIEQPNVPIPTNKFTFLNWYNTECGIVILKVYDENENFAWGGFYTNGAERPFTLMRQNLKTNEKIYWVDNDADGVFDEFYSSEDIIVAKYPNICSAIKK